jgi:hypothetical protein
MLELLRELTGKLYEIMLTILAPWIECEIRAIEGRPPLHFHYGRAILVAAVMILIAVLVDRYHKNAPDGSPGHKPDSHPKEDTGKNGNH